MHEKEIFEMPRPPIWVLIFWNLMGGTLLWMLYAGMPNLDCIVNPGVCSSNVIVYLLLASTLPAFYIGSMILYLSRTRTTFGRRYTFQGDIITIPNGGLMGMSEVSFRRSELKDIQVFKAPHNWIYRMEVVAKEATYVRMFVSTDRDFYLFIIEKMRNANVPTPEYVEQNYKIEEST